LTHFVDFGMQIFSRVRIIHDLPNAVTAELELRYVVLASSHQIGNVVVDAKFLYFQGIGKGRQLQFVGVSIPNTGDVNYL
jgi:hypothetical protein